MKKEKLEEEPIKQLGDGNKYPDSKGKLNINS